MPVLLRDWFCLKPGRDNFKPHNEKDSRQIEDTGFDVCQGCAQDCAAEEPSECPVCGAGMEWEQCWQCYGEGGWHDCGEDCCPCLDKEEITEWCEECGGEGGDLVCIALPHTDEQMAAYQRRKLEAMQ